MLRSMVCCLVSIVLLCATALAQEPTQPPTLEQRLALARAWVAAQRAYEQIPGMSVAIVHGQELIWSGGSGLADPGANRPATAETLYSICSVSKLFTSVGLMQLRDAGKLRLDDPVRTHLSWYRLKPAAEGGEVTIRGILTHSAGLPRESDYPYWTGGFQFPTHDQIVERIAAQEALYPPDTYFQYSNLGLTLAGELIAAVSGQPYDQYIRQNVLEPLGLRNTFPEMPEAERGLRLAQGFSARRRDGTRSPLPFFQTRGIAPAAGFASHVGDLARFASWQFRLLEKGGNEVLAARTLREMHRPQWVDPDLELFWGLGFATWKSDDKVFVGHQGSCPGYRTSFLINAAKKIAVVTMANASGADVGRYSTVIHDLVAPALSDSKPSDAAAKKTAPGAELAPYAGSYDLFPWHGETLVVAWGDHLAAIGLPSTEPLKNLQLLRKVGDHAFRRVRKDGALGETIVFAMGPDGRAALLRQHSNSYPRMPDPR